jgi:hypothetical protein
MQKNLLVTCTSLFVAILLISATIRRSSSGAPASHTGGPGEKTCATAGCHDDTTPNVGSAQMSLQLGENETEIIPGHTYPVKITIIDPNVNRFGFQLMALESKTHKDMGAFELTDSARTQIVTNEYKLRDRKYVTYTFDGTDALTEGKGEWIVNWTAPSDIKKGISFYLAGVSANDDMSDKGDKVYTANFNFKPAKLK